MKKKVPFAKAKLYLIAQKKEDVPASLLKNLKELSVEDVTLAIGKSITGQKLYTADIILIHILNDELGREVIRGIKTQPKLFLKPLLVFSEKQHEWREEIVDSEIVLPVVQATLGLTIEKLLYIGNSANKYIGSAKDMSKEALEKVLILQYLYTREGHILEPKRDLDSNVGYSYTLIQTLLDLYCGEDVEMLEKLEKELLLKGELVDKINLCPHCKHFQINFREVCPNCHSLQLREEPTIHHFGCAYVGREREFLDGTALRCPKCRKEIRHIGVDYERPAENFWCSDCDAQASAGFVECYCLNCARTFPPENAYLKTIYRYSLAQEGRNVAERGILSDLSLTNFMIKENGLYRFEVFKELLSLEVLKCKRYKFNSTLVLITLKNFENIFKEEGITSAQKLNIEIASFLKNELEQTAIITDTKFDNFLVLLPHVDGKDAIAVLEELKEKSKSFFRVKLDLEYKLLTIAEEKEKSGQKHLDSTEEVIKKIDKLFYLMKR